VRPHAQGAHDHGWLYRTSDRGFKRVIGAYGSSLQFVLRHQFITLCVLLVTVAPQRAGCS